ncbi:BapA prefix-like domain-containing protein, partial [Acinetobacter pittii]|uniref:BapA/Bap/LapF family prefix-like domain-containing protein n=1 Tax=Acinetobacter pittii TaxID=48296 RepID=UPI00355B4AF8
MNNFIIVEKDSLNKVNVNSQKIVLNEASIVHTKMHRADVAEFVQDGNNLLLKLKDGNVITIENFFLTYDDVKSDLVFEEDDCVLYWFDGVSGFNGISGLEVLLPEAGSKLATILPWLVGAGVVGGIAAALNNDDDKDSIPNGTITTQISSAGDISGTVTNVPAGTEVQITIKGQDKDGNALEQTITTTVDADGNYTAEVPADFADGDITVNAETTDRNGNMISAEDKLTSAKTDDPVTGGLDREEGSIEVDVDNKGNITGTTTDVVAGSTVVITVEGFDKDGNPIQEEVVAIVQPDGSYTAEVPADFADGSSIDVEATTTDRNGNTISDTDSLAGRVEDDPTTPEDESVPGGLDRIDGAITVDVENNGNITGGTTDVVPGSEVTLTITGQDKDGNPLEREVTTTVDADGNYTTEVPADFADGDITVKAETVDRNGNPVDAEDSLVKTDHDNDPNTPDQGGLDRVEGAITVEIVETGAITGTTTDVAPGTDVVLTITGKDADG